MTTYETITRTLDELDHIHDRHITSFDQELLPDLENQSNERALAIERLQKKINLFIKIAQDQQTRETDEGMKSFINRISVLLKQNRALESKVKSHKAGLERSMKNISTGKKMLSSYGSPSLAFNKPKIISYTE